MSSPPSSPSAGVRTPSIARGLISWLRLTPAVLAAVGVFVVATQQGVAAPPAPPIDLDHFRCYPVLQAIPGGTASTPPEIFVELEDQFDEAVSRTQEAIVGFGSKFCNPVEKTVPGQGNSPGETTEIIDENHHLLFYEIYEVRPDRTRTHKVTAENQFGSQTLFLRDASHLAVPTHKIDPGLEAPQGLSHFKCYDVVNRDQVTITVGGPTTVGLKDQFETLTNVVVLEAELFCNPVVKIHDGVHEIEDADAHLTCYDITVTVGVSQILEVAIDNQFGDKDLHIVTSEDILCVPTHKKSWLSFPGSFKAN